MAAHVRHVQNLRGGGGEEGRRSFVTERGARGSRMREGWGSEGGGVRGSPFQDWTDRRPSPGCQGLMGERKEGGGGPDKWGEDRGRGGMDRSHDIIRCRQCRLMSGHDSCQGMKKEEGYGVRPLGLAQAGFQDSRPRTFGVSCATARLLHNPPSTIVIQYALTSRLSDPKPSGAPELTRWPRWH